MGFEAGAQSPDPTAQFSDPSDQSGAAPPSGAAPQYGAPSSGAAPQYGAPSSGNTPQYFAPPYGAVPQFVPGTGQGTPLQGQVQQFQAPPPMYAQTAPVPAYPPTLPPQNLLPGYLQQSGTMPGGVSAGPPRFGGPLQAQPAPVWTQRPQPPLSGKVDKDGNGRPNWLPAYAYTNDRMVAPYHNMDIFFWDKRPIPNRQQWIRLSTSVSKYWRGFVPEPCMVLTVPMAEAPGNFTFQCGDPRGPRGWLQHLETTNWQGFPMYRYWLDQR